MSEGRRRQDILPRRGHVSDKSRGSDIPKTLVAGLSRGALRCTVGRGCGV